MTNSTIAKNVHQTVQGYVPPAKDQKSEQQPATSSGSRGCPNISLFEITPLIPTSHVASTASSQPTFLYYVASVPSRPARFTLVEPSVVEPLYERVITINRPGILSISAKPEIELKTEKEYVWNLKIICDEDSPSKDWIVRAVFKRVNLTNQLKQKLALAQNNFERASIYAQAGIWYDAIATSYDTKNDPQTISYFRKLLKDANLSIPSVY